MSDFASALEALRLFRARCDGPFRPACDQCAPDPCECPPCPVCGDPILSDDPDLTHTPGTERYHADCCPDCNGEPK